ncbi:putative anaphase-promoting complex subunit 3 [Monocercomonoides exilis]|uniref:putative anaphase-promoting complex subunit 3 n=1 Tax=Monocercomonoides exilis TaxID=2049356 RepID=UPI00355A954D|nr:putative anaphase-promoting complex subunit 3 [Monocercomonoides exilis]
MRTIDYIKYCIEHKLYKNAVLYAECIHSKFNSSNSLFILGKTLLDAGRYDSAISLLKEKKELPYIKILASAYYQLEQYDDVIQCFEDSEIPSPYIMYLDAPTLFFLGKSFKGRGRYKDAGDCFRRCLSLDPFNFCAYEELCSVGVCDVSPEKVFTNQLFLDEGYTTRFDFTPILIQMANAKWHMITYHLSAVLVCLSEVAKFFSQKRDTKELEGKASESSTSASESANESQELKELTESTTADRLRALPQPRSLTESNTMEEDISPNSPTAVPKAPAAPLAPTPSPPPSSSPPQPIPEEQAPPPQNTQIQQPQILSTESLPIDAPYATPISAEDIQKVSSQSSEEAMEIVSNTSNGWVLEQYGRTYYEMGQFLKANVAFTCQMEVAPHHKEGLEVFSSTLFELGHSLTLSTLSTLLAEENPDGYETLIACANYYLITDQRRKGLLCLQRACSLYPTRMYPFLLAAHECSEDGNFPLAIALYRQARLLDPMSPRVLFGLGAVYHLTLRGGNAEAYFRQAATIHPNSAAILYRLASSILDNTKADPTEHKDEDEESDAKEDEQAKAIKKSKCLEALAILNRAVELEPNNMLILARRASLYLNSAIGEYQEAVNELTSILQSKPNDSLLHYLLGIAYYNLGNKEEALKSYEKACDLAPEDELYEDAYLRLNAELNP